MSLRSAVEPGEPVPGLKSYREPEGVALPIVGARLEVAGQTRGQVIDTDRQEAVFEVDLPEGDVYLRARFLLETGKEDGAYYVYVEKR